MIQASSLITFGQRQKSFPGLLLARFDYFQPEEEIRNSFRVKTRNGIQLIVADLRNPFFPLDLKTIITDSGIYLGVTNFDLYLQAHGLFLTSRKRALCPKFDEPPGILLSGNCRRVFCNTGDLFSFSGVPTTASLD